MNRARVSTSFGKTTSKLIQYTIGLEDSGKTYRLHLVNRPIGYRELCTGLNAALDVADHDGQNTGVEVTSQSKSNDVQVGFAGVIL